MLCFAGLRKQRMVASRPQCADVVQRIGTVE
jgi:hypothetical protein